MEGGHFIGFYVATMGLVILLVWLSRASARERLGKRRIPFGIAASLLLIWVGLLGNGRRVLSYQAVLGPRDGMPLRFSQADVDRAREEFVSEAFLNSCATLIGASAVEEPKRLRDSLSMRALTAVELRESGIFVEPAPKVGEIWLRMRYEDSEPALFAALDGGDGVRRLKLMVSVAEPILPELVFFAHLEGIAVDAEKASLLEGATWKSPKAAKWTLAKLDAMAKDASPALATVIARKRAFLQKYVEEPGL